MLSGEQIIYEPSVSERERALRASVRACVYANVRASAHEHVVCWRMMPSAESSFSIYRFPDGHVDNYTEAINLTIYSSSSVGDQIYAVDTLV